MSMGHLCGVPTQVEHTVSFIQQAKVLSFSPSPGRAFHRSRVLGLVLFIGEAGVRSHLYFAASRLSLLSQTIGRTVRFQSGRDPLLGAQHTAVKRKERKVALSCSLFARKRERVQFMETLGGGHSDCRVVLRTSFLLDSPWWRRLRAKDTHVHRGAVLPFEHMETAEERQLSGGWD